MKPEPTDNAYNLAVGIGFAIFILILCIFFAALLGSSAGEVAGATGAVLGGGIGAMGAALAVYLTLLGQREEDTSRTSDAIRREVMEFSRLAIGNLENCVLIAQGTVQVPINQLPRSMKMPEPIVYRALADRLGLTNSPQQVVAFYTRLSEISSMLDIMAAGPNGPRIANKSDVALIAFLWIDILQFAKSIVGGTGIAHQYDDVVRRYSGGDIEWAIVAGWGAFL
jgi:hypothetical protein